ncbi:acyl-CoA dehydrogenase family protein [Maricurvus nonylphenolicus]|uniref:acyl-CoA dehydrogenase family protein n=1 Tax=Maricurvus nonylphenolicus TaxID=1008307 RepID=UPI0036F3896B
MNTDPQTLAAFREEVTAWLADNIPADPGFLLPLTFMEVGTEEQLEFLIAWQRKVYDAGYIGMAWPKEYGGRGMPQVYQDIVDEELMNKKAPIIFNTIGLGWAGPLILQLGTEAEKQKYIKGILTGEDIWCQGFSEPDHGSDLGNAQTRAVRDGDEYVINGSKIWTTHGSYAKYMILLARTNPEAKNKYAGLSFFLSPMQAPGITTSPIQKITGEHGFAQTFFDDARIPAECLMGEEGDGWKLAMQTLQYERSVDGGQATTYKITSITSSDLIETCRNIQRDGNPLLEDPVVQDQLVQFIMEERNLLLNQKRSSIQDLCSDYPLSLMLSGKLEATELFRRMRQYAVSLQGAKGGLYIHDKDALDGAIWQHAYFNNFSATIGGGTSQVQNNIIAEHALGLPK